VLYYLAETLRAQAGRFMATLAPALGADAAEREIQASIERLFTYGAWADKFDGQVHQPPGSGVTLAVREPLGVVGVIAPDESPLLAWVSLVAPLMALGNSTVTVVSRQTPTVLAPLGAWLDSSDVPAGVVNVLCGPVNPLADTLASHADVDALWWPCGPGESARRVEAASVSNLKRVWTPHAPDWFSPSAAEGRAWLEEATQVKNIWVPWGV
jgi:aldehyde dehydrogenase (NAD+)